MLPLGAWSVRTKLRATRTGSHNLECFIYFFILSDYSLNVLILLETLKRITAMPFECHIYELFQVPLFFNNMYASMVWLQKHVI